MSEEAAEIGGELGGGLVAAVAFLFEGLEDDGVEVAAAFGVAGGERRGGVFGDGTDRVGDGAVGEVVREGAGEDLVEQDAEGK